MMDMLPRILCCGQPDGPGLKGLSWSVHHITWRRSETYSVLRNNIREGNVTAQKQELCALDEQRRSRRAEIGAVLQISLSLSCKWSGSVSPQSGRIRDKLLEHDGPPIDGPSARARIYVASTTDVNVMLLAPSGRPPSGATLRAAKLHDPEQHEPEACDDNGHVQERDGHAVAQAREVRLKDGIEAARIKALDGAARDGHAQEVLARQRSPQQRKPTSGAPAGSAPRTMCEQRALAAGWIALPQRVTLEVVETEPVTKGQTASSSYKPAVLSNGVRTTVPPHIAVGTRIVVMTEDGSYSERAKD